MTPDELRDALRRTTRSTAKGSEAIARLAAALEIRCEECGVAWNDPGERWRTYLASEEAESSIDVLTYCPECAARKFRE